MQFNSAEDNQDIYNVSSIEANISDPAAASFKVQFTRPFNPTDVQAGDDANLTFSEYPIVWAYGYINNSEPNFNESIFGNNTLNLAFY